VESHVCKNCGETFQGNFCWKCGQKYIDRHGFYEIKNYLSEAFEFRKGTLKTLAGLLIHPAQVLKDYINRKTKICQNPFSLYLALSSGL